MPDYESIKDAMTFMDDWEARYAFLIDLGRKLQAYPEPMRDDAHKVPGCTSQVWMTYRWDEGRFYMDIDSDAHLVKGLLAVLVALYNGKSAPEILAIDQNGAFSGLGLEGHLSPNRRNGFFAVAERIKNLAASR